jgi:hypothetical protein
MSRSPTGPGSWTLASTLAGREKNGVRASPRSQTPSPNFGRTLQLPRLAALSAAGGKPSLIGLSELPWAETTEANGPNDNLLKKIRNQVKLAS